MLFKQILGLLFLSRQSLYYIWIMYVNTSWGVIIIIQETWYYNYAGEGNKIENFMLKIFGVSKNNIDTHMYIHSR